MTIQAGIRVNNAINGRPRNEYYVPRFHSNQYEVSMEVIVAVTAGLFSMIGAFLGAALARQRDYEKWLRENRSEVFAKFLNLLSEAQIKAIDAMYDMALEKIQQDVKVTDAYMPALNYVRVVCLYLPQNKRKEFRQLAQEFWALHSTRSLGDKRLQKMTEKLEEIQNIFESCL